MASYRVCLPLSSLPEQNRIPPAWAAGDQPAGAFWYFCNAYGEEWIARRFGQELVITGIEMDWREVRIGSGEVETYLARLARPYRFGQYTLDGYLLLSLEEALWMSAVIRAAFASALTAAAHRHPWPAQEQGGS